MRAKGAAAATHVVPYNQCRTQIINDRLSTPLTSMGDHLFNTLRERLPNGIKATLWPKQIQFSESMARTLRDQTMISQIVMSDASELPGRDISCRHATQSVGWNVRICSPFEIARFLRLSSRKSKLATSPVIFLLFFPCRWKRIRKS